MPTAEDRLTTLEFDFDQFKAETTTYYQEMALQVTMSKGLTEDAVKRLMQLRVQVDKRFNSVDQQLSEMKLNINDHTTRLDQIDTRLDQIDTRLDQIDTRLDQMDTRLDRMEALLAQILERLP